MENKNQYLDILLSCLLGGSILLGSLYLTNPFMGLVVFFMLGVSFIFSKRLQNNLLFFKVVFWVAANIFKPKTNLNHLIWGSFWFFVGAAFFFSPALDSRENEFFGSLLGSSEFWIGVFIVLLFNGIVGFYTMKNMKKTAR